MQGLTVWMKATTEQCGWQMGLKMLALCNKEITVILILIIIFPSSFLWLASARYSFSIPLSSTVLCLIHIEHRMKHHKSDITLVFFYQPTQPHALS